MKVKFYFDEMGRRKVVQQLAARGYEVVMANDVGMTEKDDMSEHLIYATKQGMVIVTCDHKFAGLAQKESTHAGLICWTDDAQNIGRMVTRLSQFAEEHTPDDVKGMVFWMK